MKCEGYYVAGDEDIGIVFRVGTRMTDSRDTAAYESSYSRVKWTILRIYLPLTKCDIYSCTEKGRSDRKAHYEIIMLIPFLLSTHAKLNFAET